MDNFSLDLCQLANYTRGMNNNSLGKIMRQRRVIVPLTLQELGTISNVSPSHLGRIENGGRFPSARILRKVARPLGFEEDELFALAGYLSPHSPKIAENHRNYGDTQLDPYVARVLAQEPVVVQHAIVNILAILKSIARSIAKEYKVDSEVL